VKCGWAGVDSDASPKGLVLGLFAEACGLRTASIVGGRFSILYTLREAFSLILTAPMFILFDEPPKIDVYLIHAHSLLR
jgi:hypothetical protein